MNGKWNWTKRTSIVLLLALASFATMGFTFVDRGAQEATILADHVPCTGLGAVLDESRIPLELVDQICMSAESDATAAGFGVDLINPSVVPVLDSTLSWEQYSAALKQTELIWNEKYMAEFGFRSGDALWEPTSVMEEYRGASFWSVTGTYGGDWFDVYGNATGLLELELANPEFAIH